ncbi:NADH flavin oxidoreductase/NADH oxidase [Fomitopsis schrenkii]|uniref:NADH flavin oxidoreductase/NADH oxidase n=1 Tax=Fomitopsis schrenkii TaxID=2126942 RepID=S8FIF9_FOMSC|nr:NADH flavin oxidoreductase/NADH oxidase [Fomitopsis schrenkii]
MSLQAVPKLFQPIVVGNHALAHRVVLAPLTRGRADADGVPSPHAVTYYAQRAVVPGTLLISEATFIAPFAGGFQGAPGIWSEAQVEGWKRVTHAVHEKGSRIFCQFWALGRGADPDQLDAAGLPYVSASDIKLSTSTRTPRPLTIQEIKEYFDAYANAARNAVRAGFDGVELHGANGYLIDQFLQDVSNHRTDAYGGSIENRARFALEVIEVIAKAIGPERTAIRLSPWGDVQDMRMKDPRPQFSYLVSQIAQQHPRLAYIHVVEPRVSGFTDREPLPGETNDFIREIWAPRPLISAGGHTRESAFEFAEKGDLVAFGRFFISHPDLPLRLAKNLPLVKGNRETYYTQGTEGYIDYPFAEASFSRV